MKLNKKDLITLIGGIIVCSIILLINSVFSLSGKDLIKLLSDATFFTAVMFGGLGLLMWCSDMGTFDGFTFSVKKLFSLMKKDETDMLQDYGAYKEQKHQKKSDNHGLLFTGVVFLALSLIMVLLFNI